MKGLLLALAGLCSMPALAQQGWYVGAGVGQGDSKVFPSGLEGVTPAQYDRKDAVYQLRAGWRFTPSFAVEAGYYDLGEYSVAVNGGDASVISRARARSYGLSLVAIAPWDRFDIYGRIGYARTNLDLDTSSVGTLQVIVPAQRGRTSEAIGAVGLRWWAVPRWGVFAEYQKHDKLDVDSWFVGLDYRF